MPGEAEMERAREIVGRLTKAQRAAVLDLGSASFGLRRRMADWPLPLVAYGYGSATGWHLTPLGLEVRALLQADQPA